LAPNPITTSTQATSCSAPGPTACQLAIVRLPVRPANSKKPNNRAAPLTLPIPAVDQAAPTWCASERVTEVRT